MLKTLALVLGGLVAGSAIAYWLAPAAPASEGAAVNDASQSAGAARGDSAAAARLASLEDALAAETEQRIALEARVAELGAALGELRAAESSVRSAERPDEADGPPADFPQRARFRRDAAGMAENMQRRQVELLVAAGFAPDRAEWINRRTQELRMESLQAAYDATREGRSPDPDVGLVGERTLRTELGDAEYERYLEALDRPTSINVQSVLASSPAERVGLKAGDEIVAYNGKRVFDVRELNALTLEGTAGESVVVDVRRDGQPLQLVLPRGPLGVTGGFRGPPMPPGR